jgi:hypothetical protein
MPLTLLNTGNVPLVAAHATLYKTLRFPCHSSTQLALFIEA